MPADTTFSPHVGEGSYGGTYSSFAGVDIQAVFGDVKVGNLQGISYSVTREKAPLYVMGSVDPVGFSRGKRGIAGSLIFTNFDRDAMYNIMLRSRFFRRPTDIRMPGQMAAGEEIFGTEDVGFAIPPQGQIISPGAVGANDPLAGDSVVIDMNLAAAVYNDQIPPFNITLTGQNEAGQGMQLKVFGVGNLRPLLVTVE